MSCDHDIIIIDIYNTYKLKIWHHSYTYENHEFIQIIYSLEILYKKINTPFESNTICREYYNNYYNYTIFVDVGKLSCIFYGYFRIVYYEKFPILLY